MPINSPRAGVRRGAGVRSEARRGSSRGRVRSSTETKCEGEWERAWGGLKPEPEKGEGASPCMVGARHKKGMQEDERVRGTAIKRAK